MYIKADDNKHFVLVSCPFCLVRFDDSIPGYIQPESLATLLNMDMLNK